jgi:NAD(P)-dependent dehydrogenase (short-subunit alcohol dehydrogenase family)
MLKPAVIVLANARNGCRRNKRRSSMELKNSMKRAIVMKTIPSLAGKVAVVTGASRGVGAGIATLLGEQGATVYVTGRTTASKPGTTPGTISEVADSITRAGGVGIAVVCDHADDAQIKALFERVKAEHGHLDILVNNATALGPDPYAPPPFWNKSLTISEQFTVG